MFLSEKKEKHLFFYKSAEQLIVNWTVKLYLQSVVLRIQDSAGA